jgi:ABC-2 family transporter protein
MFSRRMLKVFGALVVVAIIAGATIAFFNSGRNTGAASAEVQADQLRALASCRRGKFDIRGQGRPGFNLDRACDRLIAREHQASDPQWRYADVQDLFLGAGPLLAILCLVLGASFIGAEWQKGTITTALTWEPRRGRLLGIKFAAVALTGFTFCVMAQVILAAALWPVAALRGSTAGLDVMWLRGAAGMALRVAAIGSLTAVVGCAIATVGRNTAAALGVAFVYFGVLEGLVRGLRPTWQPWLLGDNAAQFISNQPQGPAMVGRTTADVTLTLLAYAAASIAIATTFFIRRDVT